MSGFVGTAACYWTVNDLHDFGSGTDGQDPDMETSYGTSRAISTAPQRMEVHPIAYGTVYELTPSGNGYTESILYSFSWS